MVPPQQQQQPQAVLLQQQPPPLQQQQQQPIAVVMKLDPSQPGAATMMVPSAGLVPAGLSSAAAGGVPVQIVHQLPNQAAGMLQPGTAILQVQQPPQPPQSAMAVAPSTGSLDELGELEEQGEQGVHTLPQAFEKKLRRLEKNRESARGTCGMAGGEGRALCVGVRMGRPTETGLALS